MKGLLKTLEEMLARLASQSTLNQIVKAAGSTAVTDFLNGTFAGTFPTVHLTIGPIHVTWTNADIQTFLVDVKTGNWTDMLDHAVAALDAAA
jgi:hypothetical protein